MSTRQNMPGHKSGLSIVPFPAHLARPPSNIEADRLLNDFAEWCLMTDDASQLREFTKLRESIFDYLKNQG